MPKQLDQIAATSAKDVKVTSMRIASKRFLPLQRQTVHATTHVGDAGRDPHLHARRDWIHRRSKTSSTRARATASTPESTMTRRPFAMTITIRLLAGTAGTAGAVSATTIAGTKPIFCGPSGS